MATFCEICLLSAFIVSSTSLGTVLSQDEGFSRLGNAIVASSSSVDVVGATLLLPDVVTSSEAVLIGFSVYFRSTSKVRLQIWRPVESNDRQLVYEVATTPSVADSRQDIYLETAVSPGACFKVLQGDRLGIFFEESPGAVAYIFSPTNPTTEINQLPDGASPVRVGDAVTFDRLVFPYDFSIAAHVATTVEAIVGEEGLLRCPVCLVIPEYEDDEVARTETRPASCGVCPDQCQIRKMACKRATRSRSCGM